MVRVGPDVLDRLGMDEVPGRLDEERAAVAPVVRRRGRVGADDPDPAAADLLEEFRRPGDRPAGTDPGDEMCDRSIGVGPDLRPGGQPVGQYVGGIVVLVGHPVTWRLVCDTLGQVQHIPRMLARKDRRDDHLGTIGAQQINLFRRRLVGHDDDDAVSAYGGGLSETHTGIAGRPLDDGAAG